MQAAPKRLCRQVSALNVQIQSRRRGMEDACALVSKSVLELTGVPITPGARYPSTYGTTVEEERGAVGIVQEASVKATDSEYLPE